MRKCPHCDNVQALASTAMVRYWVKNTSTFLFRWKGRLRGKRTQVCPICDCYDLGLEHQNGVPFYHATIAAWLTLHDWDWWNRNPEECEIRTWPEFGCMTFSAAALRSTVLYLREEAQDLLATAAPLTFEPKFLSPLGIPKKDLAWAEREWSKQLRILHARMRSEYSERELDVAIRMLVHPRQQLVHAGAASQRGSTRVLG